MGNIEYSAVNQPFPVFLKKGAVFSSSDAAQHFRVAEFDHHGTGNIF
jgi:hypothetical protein